MNTIPPTNEMASFISEAVNETRSLRQTIVNAMNEEDLPVQQCVIALALLAAGHAKKTRMDKRSFLALCDILYQDVKVEAPEVLIRKRLLSSKGKQELPN